MFIPGSRYINLETTVYHGDPGHLITYVRRRFLPPLTRAFVAEHEVEDPDRLDNITASYLSDPEQFWRICDANSEMRPDDLTVEVGRRLKIPSVLGG